MVKLGNSVEMVLSKFDKFNVTEYNLSKKEKKKRKKETRKKNPLTIP